MISRAAGVKSAFFASVGEKILALSEASSFVSLDLKVERLFSIIEQSSLSPVLKAFKNMSSTERKQPIITGREKGKSPHNSI